jgi:transposase
LNPPESSVSLDEKSQVQALARRQPAFPMMPGMPKKRTHDYVRQGTTTLFVALNTADGSVIPSLHRKHRAIEFRKFLTRIHGQPPEGLNVHLICDNYQTHKTPVVTTWLQNNPRFHMHFTPTHSSWLNQVERFFGFITDDLLRRSDHRNVQALESEIRKWVSEWNTTPHPQGTSRTARRSGRAIVSGRRLARRARIQRRGCTLRGVLFTSPGRPCGH